MDWRPPGWKHLPKHGFERWLDDLFFAFSEVMVLSLPVSLALVTAAESGATLAAIVVVLTLTLAVTLVRNGRTRFSERWPRFRPSTILARLVWYNGALAVAAGAGTVLDFSLAATLGSVGFATGVSVGAAATLPWAASRVSEALSWWTWGRPPD